MPYSRNLDSGYPEVGLDGFVIDLVVGDGGLEGMSQLTRRLPGRLGRL